MSPWKMVALRELMVSRAGSVNPVQFPNEVFDLYSIPAFDVGTPAIARGSEIGSTKQVVKPGDILLSKIVPHIRRSWIVGKSQGRRIIGSGEWIVFQSPHVHPEYLRNFLTSDLFHAKFMRTVSGIGGSLLRARPAQVGEIMVPLPPLPEQKRIAAILDEADSLRRKRREAIAKLDALLQSVFLEMFGDLFSNSKNWPLTSLESRLAFLTSGSRGWASHYSDKGSLFLRIQNVGNGSLRLHDVAYVQVPDSAEARRTKVKPDDVLLSITADLGRTGVVPADIGDAYVNQHLAILRLQGINPTYLSALLASPFGQRQFQRLNRQGVKAGLNFDDIKSLLVFVPPQELQKKFQKVSEQITKQNKYFTEQALEVEKLFYSLQHNAFQSAPNDAFAQKESPPLCLTLDF